MNEVKTLLTTGSFRTYNWNIPQWEDAVGRWSVRGTDTSAAMWQMSEANALKIALALFLKDCDDHPEWEAFPINAVHDEIDFEFKWNIQYEAEVAWSVYDAMGEGMRRAGIGGKRSPRPSLSFTTRLLISTVARCPVSSLDVDTKP